MTDNLSHADYAKGAEIYLHTELKVAVRTCEGKAMHGKTSTDWRVSTRIFLSHEWALIYTNAMRGCISE